MSSLPRFSIAFVHNTDQYLYLHRKAVIRALVDRGVHVFAIAPPGDFVESLEAIGVHFMPWNVARRGLNPFTELASLVTLRRILRTIRPDLVHSHTIKPNIYGALATAMLGVGPSISSVVGLGFPFMNSSISSRVLRRFLFPLYRAAFRLSDVVTFENDWDLRHLTKQNTSDQHRYVIGGTGIDLTKFDDSQHTVSDRIELRRSLGISPEEQVVILVARMLDDKGIMEYVAAARLLRKRNKTPRFLLVGPTDEGNPAAIAPEQLSRWHEEGTVQYLGERRDIPLLLSISDTVVLPTYWEGNPVSLMEAAAMGKAIVASDVPGCRMVVEHGVNGLLVPPRAVSPLADAIQKALESEELRATFGQASLEKAHREFDEEIIAKRFLDLYERLLVRTR